MVVEIVCDLRHLLGPARDQGIRPTCLAFTASDTHAALRSGWEPLSCEHAYYHAVRRSGGNPHDGVTLPAMMAVLREDGQPTEAAWPYLPILPTNLADWKPPANLGPLFRRAGQHAGPSITEILNCLDRGIPVIVTMSLSDAFYVPDVQGIIAASEPVDPSRRHAVVAVGYGMRRSEKLVLVRNSWGTAWGLEGHGWVSEAYLVPRLLEVAELMEDLTDVSSG